MKDKEISKLADALDRAGFEVRVRKSNHAQVFDPDGEFVTGLGSTPSENRGWNNVLSRIRRAGWIYVGGEVVPLPEKAVA
jgi:hypothetical protein